MKLISKYPVLFMVISMVAGGGGTVFAKGASAAIAVFVIAGFRYAVMSTAIMPLFIKEGSYKSKEFLKKASINTAMQIGSVSCWMLSVERLQSITITVIMLLIPLFVYYGSIFILKEKPSTRALAGTLVALSGSVLIFIEPLISETSDVDILGVALAFASVLFGTGVIVHAKSVLKIASATSYICYRSIVLTIYFFAAAYIMGDLVDLPPIDDIAWLYTAGFALIAGLIGNTVFYLSLKHMNVEDSSSLIYIDPLTGVVLGILLLGESFTTFSLIGTVIVIAGVLIAHPVHVHHTMHLRHPHLHDFGHRKK